MLVFFQPGVTGEYPTAGRLLVLPVAKITGAFTSILCLVWFCFEGVCPDLDTEHGNALSRRLRGYVRGSEGGGHCRH